MSGGKKISAPARIADVARLAGVSSATVSRTLAAPHVVAEKTRRKVMEAVRQTGYTPNIAARNLRVRKTMMALVVVPDIRNSFFGEILHGVDETLSAHGYGLIIANLDDSPEKEARYCDLALAGQVDGVLLLCGHLLRGAGRELTAENIPTVAACEIIPGATFPQVEVNNCEAAEGAVRHLAALGHRRIAYVSGPRSNILDHARHAGYRNALAACGLAADAGLVFSGDFTFGAGAHAARAILALPEERRPTAIFAANDEMAIGILKTLVAAGYSVPGDFSIVGFDAIAYADYCEPTLTTVFQPRREIGVRAAELLIDELNGVARSQKKLIVLPCRLLIRNSTGGSVETHAGAAEAGAMSG